MGPPEENRINLACHSVSKHRSQTLCTMLRQSTEPGVCLHQRLKRWLDQEPALSNGLVGYLFTIPGNQVIKILITAGAKWAIRKNKLSKIITKCMTLTSKKLWTNNEIKTTFTVHWRKSMCTFAKTTEIFLRHTGTCTVGLLLKNPLTSLSFPTEY